MISYLPMLAQILYTLSRKAITFSAELPHQLLG